MRTVAAGALVNARARTKSEGYVTSFRKPLSPELDRIVRSLRGSDNAGWTRFSGGPLGRNPNRHPHEQV
jgi:hypothetical protein